MLRKGLFIILPALAIYAAGFWTGRETVAQARSNQVYELRTYTTLDGKLDALHARFRNHTVKLFAKHGITNIGYFKPMDPPLAGNTLIYLLGHSSREAARKSFEAFRADPAWIQARDESEKNGKIVQKVESVFLEPADYSPMK